MASESDLLRVHDRIDALGNELREGFKSVNSTVSDLTVTVERNIAQCEMCRPVVMGDGNKPLNSRVTSLESRDQTRTRILWGILALIGAPILYLGAWVVTKVMAK